MIHQSGWARLMGWPSPSPGAGLGVEVALGDDGGETSGPILVSACRNGGRATAGKRGDSFRGEGNNNHLP